MEGCGGMRGGGDEGWGKGGWEVEELRGGGDEDSILVGHKIAKPNSGQAGHRYQPLLHTPPYPPTHPLTHPLHPPNPPTPPP